MAEALTILKRYLILDFAIMQLHMIRIWAVFGAA
jgi:hypothetical protein